jgi:hypothetical protein
MQPTFEEPLQHRAVEPETFPPVHFTKSSLRECGPPLSGRPVRIAEWYAMADIAHPVHHPQPLVAQPRSSQVILDDYLTGRDSRGFSDEEKGVIRVVEDVDEHDQIVRTIGEWKNPPIELLNGYRRVRACAYLDAGRAKARPPVNDRARQCAITATHVEKRRAIGGNHLRDILGERPHAPAKDQPAMQIGGDARQRSARHGRRSWRISAGALGMTYGVSEEQRSARGAPKPINVRD